MGKQTIHTRRQIQVDNEKPVAESLDGRIKEATEARTRAEYNKMKKHALSEMLTLRDIPHNKRWIKDKLIGLLLADDKKRARDWR